MIPLSVPSLKGNELKYIQECVETEWVSSVGKYVELFETKIADYTGSKFAIATVNGTSALHISLILSDTKPGDEVIVPTITFIAPVNTVMYLRAEPIFMDSDNYYNISSDKTIEFIKTRTYFENGFTYNKNTGKRIKAIIPVHIFGNAVLFDELFEICRERNITIIEDATESLGTRYISGKFAGCHTGTIGELGCLSFNGNKIITTGGGGMILTSNADLAAKAKYLTTQAKDDKVRYIHNEIGYNYRLTNIQAALGVAQLENIEKFITIKKNNYNTYKNAINNIPGLSLAEVPDYADSNYWMYALVIDKNIYGKDREQLMKYLGENEIQSRPLWQLNHLQKPYKECYSYKIEKSYELLDNTLNIPCSVNLLKEDIDFVIEKLKGFSNA